MHLAKLALFCGIIALVLLVQRGHFTEALLLVGAGMLWGIWRIWRVIAEAREREARMWQMDTPIQPPRSSKKVDS